MTRLGLVAATAAAVAFLCIPAVPQTKADSAPSTEKSSADTYRQLNLFAEVFERVRSDYV